VAEAVDDVVDVLGDDVAVGAVDVVEVDGGVVAGAGAGPCTVTPLLTKSTRVFSSSDR
jgi:hypothetical protein